MVVISLHHDRLFIALEGEAGGALLCASNTRGDASITPIQTILLRGQSNKRLFVVLAIAY